VIDLETVVRIVGHMTISTNECAPEYNNADYCQYVTNYVCNCLCIWYVKKWRKLGVATFVRAHDDFKAFWSGLNLGPESQSRWHGSKLFECLLMPIYHCTLTATLDGATIFYRPHKRCAAGLWGRLQSLAVRLVCLCICCCIDTCSGC